MITFIDYYLDRITMYRFTLFYLIAIIGCGVLLAGMGMLPMYTADGILISASISLILCLATNVVFSRVFDAPTNLESSYITALIIVCLVPPIQSTQDLPLLVWAAILAIASKFILAIRNKHVFNPAAIAVVLTAVWLNLSAAWWIGTGWMIPVTLIGGLLLVRKIRRIDMMYGFFVAAIITITLFTASKGGNILDTAKETFLRSPILFFAFVMLTEPLTSPPTQFLQVIYGAIVGVLSAPQIHFASYYLTPEMALVAGNVFSFAVSPKIKEKLTLTRKTFLAPDVMEFEFAPARQLKFTPGQYMEFTLPHERPDTRGTRRYLTVASSPTEDRLLLGVKFYHEGSSFKTHLADLELGKSLMGGQLAGDFTLPKDETEKLVFIAGGIGITPFRSMLKYLSDTNSKRDIVLIYMNKTVDEIAYADIFSDAEKAIGARIVYTLTGSVPSDWKGKIGRVDAALIQDVVPDFMSRTFYLSGPHTMITGVENTLQELRVPGKQIKKDFFPGLA